MNSEKSSSDAPFLLLHRITPLTQSAIALILLATLVLFQLRAFTGIGSGFLGGVEGDAGLYIWLARSNLRDLWTLPWFNTRMLYPYGETLAWSDNFILPSLVIGAFSKLGLSFETAYNVTLLGAEFLNGWIAARLMGRLTGRLLPSVAVGISFMTLPFFNGHLGHPQLQFGFFLPLMLLSLIEWVASPTFLRALLCGLVVDLAFLTTVYYAVFCAVFAFLFLIAVFALRPRYFARRDLGSLLLGGGVAGAALIPFLLPYLQVMNAFGRRELYEPYYFSATALSYLATPPLNLLYASTASWSHAEAYLFPGVVLLVLGLLAFKRLSEARALQSLALATVLFFSLTCVASAFQRFLIMKYATAVLLWVTLGSFVWLAVRMARLEARLGFKILTNRSILAIFLFLALASFALSFGPLGNPVKHELPLGIFSVFYGVFPGFSALRAVGRIGVMADLCLIISAGLALDHLLQKGRSAAIIAGFLPALIAFEHYAVMVPLDPLPPQSPVFNYLNGLPRSAESMIVLPMAAIATEGIDSGHVESWGDFARKNIRYLNAAFPSARMAVNGYSGQRSKLMRELPEQLAGFPDDRSLAALRKIVGLRYIVYSSAEDRDFDKSQFEKKMRSFAPALNFIMADSTGDYLFELGGMTRITSATNFLVPSYATGTLTAELSALADNAKEPAVVEIYAGTAGDDLQKVSEIEVPANGEIVSATLDLKPAVDRVRPREIGFRVDPKRMVTVGRTRFE